MINSDQLMIQISGGIPESIWLGTNRVVPASQSAILTESGLPIFTEDGLFLLIET